MKRAWAGWILLAAAFGVRAQSPPAPELGLDVNGQNEAVVARGWPLLIRAAGISADGQPVKIGANSGSWTQALRLTVMDASGAAQSWPMQLAQAGPSTLTLSGINNAEAVWLVAPADTAPIPAGVYSLSATLDTTSGAAAGTWSGSVRSNGSSVQLQVEPSSLAPEEEASKYLAIAAYARLRGDKPGVGTALDTLMAHQPDILEAYVEKADLLADGGDYAGALALYQQARAKFLAKNPNPDEPLTLFTAPAADIATKLANQQGAATTVTSVAPGSTTAAFAPDSVVNAYGSGLATTKATASGAPSTPLGGTTVAIADSSGASTPAPLFFVSPGQVNYLAPASVALGPATITLKTGDGSTRTGKVTIVDVQPGLLTLNAAGLIAANIVRATAAGQQIFQDIYALDDAGNIVAAPVDVSQDQVYLTLYGTGFRHASTSQATISIGGVTLPAIYAGAQGVYAGLDQVNVLLPAALAGRGDIPLSITVAGVQSNTARITIK